MIKGKLKRHTDKYAKNYAEFILKRIELSGRDVNEIYNWRYEEKDNIYDLECEVLNIIESNGYINGELARCPYYQYDLIPLSELL